MNLGSADGAVTVWNPAEYGGEVPRLSVQAAVEELFDRYTVTRMYCDPELWQSEIGPLMQEAGVTSEPAVRFWRKLETGDDIGWGAE